MTKIKKLSMHGFKSFAKKVGPSAFLSDSQSCRRSVEIWHRGGLRKRRSVPLITASKWSWCTLTGRIICRHPIVLVIRSSRWGNEERAVTRYLRIFRSRSYFLILSNHLEIKKKRAIWRRVRGKNVTSLVKMRLIAEPVMLWRGSKFADIGNKCNLSIGH